MPTGTGSSSTDPASEGPRTEGSGRTGPSRRWQVWHGPARKASVWTVLAAAAIVLGASLGADWATGWSLLPYRSGGSSPSDPCGGPAWRLYGTLSEPLDSATNLSYERLASQFESLSKGCATLLLNSSSAPTGLPDLASGASQFVVLPGFPTPGAIAGLPYPALYFPESVGAVAVVYNPAGLPSELNLTPAVLAGIFLGTIQNWTDPTLTAANPQGINASSGPIFPSYLSGSTDATAGLTAYLSGANSSWNASIGEEASPHGFHGLAISGEGPMIQYVLSTPGAIGYVQYGAVATTGVDLARLENLAGAFALPNSTGLTEAASGAGEAALTALEHSNGTIGPGPNLTAADAPGNWSYPATTFDYVLLYHDLGQAYGGWLTMEGSLWFLWFFVWLSNGGQAGFTGPGFVPLPGVVSAMTLSVLEHVTYRGQPVLSSALGEGEGPGEGGNESGEP